ncbi:hypothetical protein KP509_26G038700 [Ceratopteris richardii]|uniref:2-carboxy-D-arabinitol-1-phosphatase n=1 Tax=Ceratopteris richardii TaxID=49495 RepID=A0A8T2RMN5_CERRI|nr:hypothetical protein KP509_26G038700 [Ceratopteris richardii]
MNFTCNACCYGRSDVLIPAVSASHFHSFHSPSPSLLDRELIANVKCSYSCGLTGSCLLRERKTCPDCKTLSSVKSILGAGVWGRKRGGALLFQASLLPNSNGSTVGDLRKNVNRAYGPNLAEVIVTGSDQATDKASKMPVRPIVVPELPTLPSIPAPKRVVLVRHGQSTWNAEGRIQGSSDFAVLTAKGEIQAETSRQMLLSDFFDVCFYSPLARAKRTAEIIWGERTEPMISIHDLREIDLYGFQGLMKNEGKERYGDAYRTWQVDAANFLIDGHYPVRELWARAHKCWDEILRHEGQSILVVAHNAVNQALVATATGLGPHYFRQLLQSNCGVSVLDFSPQIGSDGPPYVCLDRLNQTPSPPVAAEQGSGRKAGYRVILVCHGATETSVERFPASADEPLNMLGVIQAQKTAELLLDVTVNSVLCSPQPNARRTAKAIVEVQEAADCLGADCVPRYVEENQLEELADLDWGQWKGQIPTEVVPQGRWQDAIQHVDNGGESIAEFWKRAGHAWKGVLDHLKSLDAAPSSQTKNVVVVAHEVIHTAMIGHCLGLTPASIGTFHVDTGSISVVDLPDGPSGRGVVRCLNYTAHLGRWAVPITLPTLADEDF